MTIRIGISGWRYTGWRGVFYPEKWAQARELEFASRQLQTIEINGSHYSLQSRSSYINWRESTPDDFIFAVKGPRYLTHMLRFREPESDVALANFFASGLFCLGEKLGPILWQFPPSFRFDPTQFERILAKLPQDTEQAAALARKHDARVKDPYIPTKQRTRLRHAVEIRHASFIDEAFVDLLRKHGAALVVSDSVADWPYAEDVTSDFIYIRLHGTETLYSGSYSDDALDDWSKRIRAWGAGKEPDNAKRIGKPSKLEPVARNVYCYFDNDVKVQAPFDAKRLMAKVGV